MFNKEQLEALIITLKENISLAESLLKTQKYEDAEAVKDMIASQQKTLEDYTDRLENIKVGRPSIGITKKISLTLPEPEWEWFDKQADGNRSQFVRRLVWERQSPENEWDNYACLGYAILGARNIGLSEEKIKELVQEIYGEFDWKSVPEANEIYRKSSY